MEQCTTAIIILGASGDLTRRKIIPALERLFDRNVLGRPCVIVGSGRSAFSHEEFRNRFSVDAAFAETIFYHQGIKGLREFLDSKGSFSRIVVFMSLPPEAYAATARELYDNGFRDDTSLIVEKPFGYDYASAVALDKELARFYPDERIFRNDHYLAKESVQNILVFRFANQIFQPLWNSQHIESIQISAVETQGVGIRGPYFDKAGIIRDMVQNHLMQLLSLMTMEPPVSLNPADIGAKKIDLLRALTIDKCVRYQYDGYRGEKGVDPQSSTETFAEFRLSVNNLCWAGMPIYLRCGKALNRTGTEISVRFKPSPRVLFNERGELPQNTILFKIQPAEGIIINMSSKEPGNEIRLSDANMAFCYRDTFESEIPEAYQRILIDAIRGDHTLFVTAQESELLWKIVEPVLDRGPVLTYKKGDPPPTSLDVSWTDFDKYSTVCA
jgi:glucose-6-phosphate 1-dehydrogenase